MPVLRIMSMARSIAADLLSPRWRRGDSASCSPTRITGISAVSRPARRGRDFAGMLCRSWPRYWISPDSTLTPAGSRLALARSDVEADVIDDEGCRPALALHAEREVAHDE